MMRGLDFHILRLVILNVRQFYQIILFFMKLQETLHFLLIRKNPKNYQIKYNYFLHQRCEKYGVKKVLFVRKNIQIHYLPNHFCLLIATYKTNNILYYLNEHNI